MHKATCVALNPCMASKLNSVWVSKANHNYVNIADIMGNKLVLVNENQPKLNNAKFSFYCPMHVKIHHCWSTMAFANIKSTNHLEKISPPN